jgi:signal transduction histidine kinase
VVWDISWACVPSLNFNGSIGTRLALGNGAILVGTILVTSAVIFYGTVGVLDRSIDGKIVEISNHLFGSFGTAPIEDLEREIKRELTDGIDSDTEIFLLASPAGQPMVGNLSDWPGHATPRGQLLDREVTRDGRLTAARLIIRELPNGDLLYVGRGLGEQQSIRALVLRALGAAAMISLLLAVVGAYLFHREIAARIGEIRRTAGRVAEGNLVSRIPISGNDEFARLGVDINRMLDRIEQLVDGVRHVSNAIAHDLRTPLTRIRSRLDEVLSRESTIAVISAAAYTAIDDIDDLILVFNKLLQIAEAESGVPTDAFDSVDLNRIVQDMVELYDAAAEERHVQLHIVRQGPVWARGDHDLLASAVASLIDNAIKYAGPGSRVELSAHREPPGAAIVVQDNGPGVPEVELPRLVERFYRVDRARSQSGNGLGLAIASAIATLHSGSLKLANAAPGFRASIVLPAENAPSGESAVNGPMAAPTPVQLV